MTSTNQQIAEKRRSIYALSDNLPINEQQVVDIAEHAILHTPSAFNSQSTRILVLFGAEHQKLWQKTEDILRSMVNDDDKFKATAEKMAGFRAGAGTILFFEDQTVIKGLQEKFAAYADNFPVWAEHTNAMHQYAIWTTLTEHNIGANLQHYNPLIDEFVQQTWNIDPSWQLRAELVFGTTITSAGDKQFAPLESRLKVAGI